MANATITGTILRPGDIPLAAAKVIAVPTVPGAWIPDVGGINYMGASVSETDSAGVIQGGLIIPISAGVVWNVYIRPSPDDRDVPPAYLGTFNLNTSGDLKDQVPL